MPPPHTTRAKPLRNNLADIEDKVAREILIEYAVRMVSWARIRYRRLAAWRWFLGIVFLISGSLLLRTALQIGNLSAAWLEFWTFFHVWVTVVLLFAYLWTMDRRSWYLNTSDKFMAILRQLEDDEPIKECIARMTNIENRAFASDPPSVMGVLYGTVSIVSVGDEPVSPNVWRESPTGRSAPDPSRMYPTRPYSGTIHPENCVDQT